jgi:hypothetical protein
MTEEKEGGRVPTGQALAVPVEPASSLAAPRGDPSRKKASHIGAPAVFKLELACQQLHKAFPESFGCYLVGSAQERPDWRDVDVRCIMVDDEFTKMFPNGGLTPSAWEFDQRWLILTTSISQWLRDQTGLPIDFQFQAQTFANKAHPGQRSALGMGA